MTSKDQVLKAYPDAEYMAGAIVSNYAIASEAFVYFSEEGEAWESAARLLPASEEPTPKETVDPATKLLADVMHLWIDGYISKAPESAAEDAISSGKFNEVEQFLATKGISVDYCGWSVEPAPKDWRCEREHSIVDHVYSPNTGKSYCRACACKEYIASIPATPEPAPKEGEKVCMGATDDGFEYAKVPAKVESGDGLDKASELLEFNHGYYTYDSVQAFREEAERQLQASLLREQELRELLKKSMQLASIGYRIGEADMRGHDKIGERYSKQQDELIAEIRAAVTGE